jgi:hypothetical protein
MNTSLLTTAPSSRVQARFWIWAAVIVIGLSLLFTIRPGQPWDGDAELYIMNALNILHGSPYGNTDYVINPAFVAPQPASYPPGLPFLMVPVLALFGINYVAIKATLILCFIGLLAVMTRVASLRLQDWWIASLVVALGLNPYVWIFRNTVYSEFAFMLFTYLGMFCFDRVDRAAANNEERHSLWLLAVLSGVCFGAAYSVRTVGIVLCPAVIALTLFRYRQLRWLSATVAASAAVFGGLLAHLFPFDAGTYRGFMLDSGPWALFTGIPGRSRQYLRALGTLCADPENVHWNPAKKVLVLFLLILLALGLIRAIRRWPTIYEAFFVSYLGFFLVFPGPVEIRRYTLPLLPLALFYMTDAAQSRLRIRGLNLTPVSLALAVAMLYIPQYTNYLPRTTAPADPVRYAFTVDAPEAQQIYAQIREQVPKTDLILCLKPTVIALYTHRRSTNLPPEPADYLTSVRQSAAAWLLVSGPLRGGSFAADESRGLRSVVAELGDQLQLKFENRMFALYQIMPATPALDRSNVHSGTARSQVSPSKAGKQKS